MDNVCFLCGRWVEHPDRHHLIGGVFRSKSEKFGLVVPLCRGCHGQVHRDGDLMHDLRQLGQRKAMKQNGWSVDDFIREFGKNYL